MSNTEYTGFRFTIGGGVGDPAVNITKRDKTWRSCLIGLMASAMISITMLSLVIAKPAAALFSDTEDSENEAIQYKRSVPIDAISKLQKDIDDGKIRLTASGRQGVLRSLLNQLHIPVEFTDKLVFSKTSFQRELITPTNPRALYFNDHTYIGWVQGSPLIEVATMDPRLGTVFYIMDQNLPGKPVFKRETDACLECHETSMSGKVPGNIMRSVYPHADGQPEFSAGSYLTDDSSPMEERWGGWYVTGTYGGIRHMGNAVVHVIGNDSGNGNASGDNVTLDRNSGANITSLTRFFATSHYLAPTSDIVALMVAEHQTHVENLITRASYQTRIAERYDEALNRDLNRPSDYHSDSMRTRIVSVCEPLVKAMLFTEEPPLANAIVGSNSYATQFARMGPSDSRGRSLRQLDLHTRLMRYRCSYLIYSDLFNALPDRAKTYVYRRLNEILSGKDNGKDFASITAATAERTAILELLKETKPDFAAATKGGAAVLN